MQRTKKYLRLNQPELLAALVGRLIAGALKAQVDRVATCIAYVDR